MPATTMMTLDDLLAELARPAPVVVPVFDPLSMLDGFERWTTIGRQNALAEYLRYMAGEPLVRYDRRGAFLWTFLCPVPSCRLMSSEHPSAVACREAWLEHCVTRPHPAGFTPSWPHQVALELLDKQPDRTPRVGQDYNRAVAFGHLVDVAGRPLRLVQCQTCRTHMLPSGSTCPVEVSCTSCGVEPGALCRDRSGMMPGDDHVWHRASEQHAARVTAGWAVDDARAAAGDTRVPALWRDAKARVGRGKSPRPCNPVQEFHPVSGPIWAAMDRGEFDLAERLIDEAERHQPYPVGGATMRRPWSEMRREVSYRRADEARRLLDAGKTKRDKGQST